MYNAPQALQQILRGDVSQARAINKDPHQEQATSETNIQIGDGSGNSHSDGDGYREECDDYKRTMREKKRCRTSTAPRGLKRTTSSDNCDDQPLDPKKRGLEATSRIDEDGGSKRCRRTKGAKQKRPPRSKTKQTMQEQTHPRTNTQKDPKQRSMQDHPEWASLVAKRYCHERAIICQDAAQERRRKKKQIVVEGAAEERVLEHKNLV